MMIPLRRLCALSAGAAILSFAAVASAGEDPSGPPMPPQGPVAECVDQIREGVQAASMHIRTATDRTIARIRTLDEEGATDRKLAMAAARGLRAIGEAGSAGASHVRMTTRQCIMALHEIGAPREAIGAVAMAHHRAIHSIHSSAERGSYAIRHALRVAINNDDGDDGPGEEGMSGASFKAAL